MNTTKRLLCLLLVLTMLVGVLAGCNGDSNKDPKDTDDGTTTTAGDDETGDGDKTTAGDDDTTGGDDTEDPRKADTLAPSYDFGGVQEFVVLSRASTTYEFESAKGDNLSGVEQAIYDRNSATEERCNVEIVVIPREGGWSDAIIADFIGTLRANNALPVSEYDLVATHQAYLSSAVLEGYSWDFDQLPNIDLSKIWWSEAYYNEVNYNGAIYMMYGDIAYTLYEYLEVIFFNEQLAEDLGIDGLYELALDGDWTFGKLKEYTSLVTANPDADEANREYGFLTNSHSQRSFLSSLGVDLAPVNADGKHEFAATLHVSQSTPLQEFINFVTANPQVLADCNNSTAAGLHDPIFAEGRALFYSQTLDSATYLKGEMAQNYGLLPFPKYDDLQKDYVTGIRDTVTGIMVPYNCKNAEMAGTVTEMLSMYSFQEVTDAYYEEKLKYQSFNNPLCVQTLELIRTSFAPSFVMTFSYYMNFANSMFSGSVASSVSAGVPVDVNTNYKSGVGTYRKRCRDLYKMLDKIAEKRAAA